MTTVSNVTLNVDVSDELLELIANLQARVDSLESKSKTPFEKARDSGEFNKFFSDIVRPTIGLSEDDYCSCDACNRGEESEPQPFVVIDGTTYINFAIIKDGMIDLPTDKPEFLELKSVNYVEGKSGWILAKDGVLHIYSGNEKINFYQDGSHNKSNRELFERYDENNTCRVRFGQVEL